MDTTQVKYSCPQFLRRTRHTESIKVIGIDTEAYRSGKCFMVATSTGDVFSIKDFPACLFTRKYRGKQFVVYNLKYDSGAFLQSLPPTALKTLMKTGKVVCGGYGYKAIANKCLIISRGKNCVTFYDMYNFYSMKLEDAASAYLEEHKVEQDVRRYTPQYVQSHGVAIGEYCVHDAVLVKRLADLIIKHFEALGVYPQRLYSVAYVSYQYFRSKCPYVTVRKYWENHREVLDFAMRSYQGGKFEVTEKGVGYYYEYDMVSSYPSEIAKLIDISWARVVHSPKYRKAATYGFILCHIKVPYGVFSPIVVLREGLNTYPIGEYERVITKAEYEYLLSAGCDVSILEAWWLYVDKTEYPYRTEINRLAKLKQTYQVNDQPMYYHTAKLLMNTLYGKFLQLIKSGDYYHASACWNPIYGSVITAAARIKVTAAQQAHESVVAVHTDSIISKEPLPYAATTALGAFSYETEGKGIILGSGVYQIGDKVALRGFSTKHALYDLLVYNNRSAPIAVLRPYTWREVMFHNWNKKLINYFDAKDKQMRVNFDSKRLWLDDWQKWTDVDKRKVYSEPLAVCPALF